MTPPAFCRDCARYNNEPPAIDTEGKALICPTCKVPEPVEQFITVELPDSLTERTALKLFVAQGARDLDEQGLRNVLAAMQTERERQKAT